MNKLVVTIIGALCIFVGGFLTAKHFYQNDQDKTAETDVSHTKTHTVETKRPDGTTTTVTDTDSTSKSTSTTVAAIRPKTNVSLLVANDFKESIVRPVYGISVQREFLGPVTLGVFGLTNSTIGLSIGFNF